MASKTVRHDTFDPWDNEILYSKLLRWRQGYQSLLKEDSLQQRLFCYNNVVCICKESRYKCHEFRVGAFEAASIERFGRGWARLWQQRLVGASSASVVERELPRTGNRLVVGRVTKSVCHADLTTAFAPATLQSEATGHTYWTEHCVLVALSRGRRLDEPLHSLPKAIRIGLQSVDQQLILTNAQEKLSSQGHWSWALSLQRSRRLLQTPYRQHYQLVQKPIRK